MHQLFSGVSQRLSELSLSFAIFCLLNLLDGSVFVVATPGINADLHVLDSVFIVNSL